MTTLSHLAPARPVRRLRRSGHAGRAALLLVTVLAGFIAVSAASASPASALCISNPITGSWHNINPNTSSITRAQVDFSCNDVILCDTNGHCSGGGSSWAISLWGKCHPTDCAWGSRPATMRSDGWLRTTYNHGYATRDVWLKTYVYSGITYLRVYVHTDFTAADGRTDYTTDEWMLK